VVSKIRSMSEGGKYLGESLCRVLARDSLKINSINNPVDVGKA
jgi:hypothetical protein